MTTQRHQTQIVTEVEIARPDDWHLHLRDNEMLEAVIGESSRWFGRVIVMPNLVPPVITVAQAKAYKERIEAAIPQQNRHFEPLMTLYANEETNLDELADAYNTNTVAAIKFYPQGATTNSQYGAASLATFMPMLEKMVEIGMPLLVHSESTDPNVDLFDREAHFIETQLAPVLEKIPELSVTVEHLSTQAGVELVKSKPQVFGTITPHHLACDRTDMLAHGMKPDLYCKPVLNRGSDREALVAAATSGDPSFMLGTDSAPHTSDTKYAETVCAGVFCATHALEIVAEIFHENAALDKLEAFCSTNGAKRYNKPISDTKLKLTRHTEPKEPGQQWLDVGTSDKVKIFGTDTASYWTISPVL